MCIRDRNYIASYKGGFEMCAAFDVKKELIGKDMNGYKILDNDDLVDYVEDKMCIRDRAMHVEKEKDAIILYINIHENLGEMPIDEDMVFGMFENMARKYNLGIIYDGFKEDLDEQKI